MLSFSLQRQNAIPFIILENLKNQIEIIHERKAFNLQKD